MDSTVPGAKRPVSLILRGCLTESARSSQSIRSRGSALDHSHEHHSREHMQYANGSFQRIKTENLEEMFPVFIVFIKPTPGHEHFFLISKNKHIIMFVLQLT